jgi:short-subunit dehydrogenase
LPTALITGASSGLGEQFAYALAREKYDVALTARREDRLLSVAARAKELGAARAEIIPADLTRRGTPLEICQHLELAHIAIDYLVNNAGFGTRGYFDRIQLDRELEEIDVNVTAPVALTRLLLPGMVERRHGTVINVTSTAAFQAVPYMSTYAATKAFVLSFTEGLAGELVGTGVKVLAFCPGPVKTEFETVAQTEKSMMPGFVYTDAQKVVAGAIAAAASGRTVYIAGGLNFTMAQLTRLVPRALVNRIARNIYRPAAGR